MLSRRDAELAYDGRIPPGVIDPNAPDLFTVNPHARIGRVVIKPEAIRARMVRAMTMLAAGGAILESDLVRAGFTAAEIAAHAADALRQVMVENPTFTSIEWAA